MAYSYTWPATLPDSPLIDGYQETIGPCVLSTPMDHGLAKRRRIAPSPDIVPMQVELTSAQLSTLQTFVNDTLQGVARFGWVHPRLGTVVEWRFVPGENNKLLTLAWAGVSSWAVSFTLEKLP